MPDPNPPPEPPMVLRVEADPPLVLPVEPPRPKPPRPGLFEAALYTLGYAAVVFGTLGGIVAAALLYEALFGGPGSLKPPEGKQGGTVGALPPELMTALGWAVVAGYAAGVGFTVLVFRRLAGRDWAREVGLKRFPPAHLLLALVAFPGFTVGSELLAAVVNRLVGMDEFQVEAAKGLGDLLRPFHWSFAVFAVGVCPGVAEELWCRGVLGRGLVGRYGVVGGVVLTSMFFGLLHLYPPAYVLLTVVMGTALHFVYLASRSLWVPILLHTLNNGFAALAAVGVVVDPMGRALTDRPLTLAGLTAGVVVFVGLAMWSARARVVTEPATPDADPFPGLMVPPAEAGMTLTAAPPKLRWAVPAVGFSAALVWLLFA